MLSTQLVRSVTNSDTGDLVKERAMMSAERGAESAKHELGRMVVDAVEEYFPEETKDRRRRVARRAFFAGMALGLFLGAALRRPSTRQ